MLDGPNHPEFIQAMFAIWRAGAVVAPVNSRLHDSDIADIASVCKPVAMLAHDSLTSHVAAVLSAVSLEAGVITWDTDDGTGTSNPLWESTDRGDGDRTPDEPGEAGGPVDAPVWVDDPAWYFFTSGTSGSPKAAVLTHDQLGYVVTNHLADLMPATDETHASLVVAPLSHGAGVHLLPQVARGAKTVLPSNPSLTPTEAWRLIENERVTNMFTVPTIVKLLVEDPSAREHDLSSLRYVIYAGAPMPTVDQQQRT